MSIFNQSLKELSGLKDENIKPENQENTNINNDIPKPVPETFTVGQKNEKNIVQVINNDIVPPENTKQNNLETNNEQKQTNVESKEVEITFDLIKNKYNLPFDESEFKTVTEKFNEWKNLDNELLILKEKTKKIEEERDLLDGVLQEFQNENPLSFLKENEYKALKLVNDNPELNSKVLLELSSSNLKEMNSFELMVKHQMLNHPQFSEKAISESLAEKYNVDLEDRQNWTDKDLYRFELEAKGIRKELSEMLNSVQLPKKVSIDEFRNNRLNNSKLQEETLYKQFSDTFNTINKEGVNAKISIKDDFMELNNSFKYSYDNSFNESLNELAKNWSKMGVEVTPELKQKAEIAAKGVFLANNFENIIQTFANDIYSSISSSFKEKVHNSTIPRQTPPVTQTDGNNDAFLKNAPFNRPRAGSL